MTYNNQHNVFPMASGLGAPGAGFASRGKGTGLKRLSLATAPKVGSISENPLGSTLEGTAVDQDCAPTPRTSRSHLLAGLRTQPRTPSALQTSASLSVSSSVYAPPASAPYYKTTHNTQPYGVSGGHNQYSRAGISHANVPHTAVGANFPSHVHQQHQNQHQLSLNPGQQVYTLPEQILAPPPLEIDDGDDHLDPDTMRQLHAAETYLNYRQQQLQQLQQQISAMQYSQGTKAQASFPQTPVTPQQYGLYQQQLLASISWVQIPGTTVFVADVGQPGVYLQHNMQTNETGYTADPAITQWMLQTQAAALALSASPPPQTPSHANHYMASGVSQPAFGITSPVDGRSRSPPKKSTSPEVDVTPLPPPSANAFRRGHTRNRSSLVLQPGAINQSVAEGPRSAMVRPVGMPATPMTGTFGPGGNRVGDHPLRQPFNPPPIEELKEKPTTYHEGSKNFSSRQRRRAVNTLVKAGLERRSTANTTDGSGSSVSTTRPGSGGSLTPVSDNDTGFSLPASSDNDSDVASTGKTSPSMGASEHHEHAKLAVEKALAANLAGMSLLSSRPGIAAPGN